MIAQISMNSVFYEKNTTVNVSFRLSSPDPIPIDTLRACVVSVAKYSGNKVGSYKVVHKELGSLVFEVKLDTRVRYSIKTSNKGNVPAKLEFLFTSAAII